MILFIVALMAACCSAQPKKSFEDNFSIMWSEDHFKTSEDGQIWYLNLDKDTGTFLYNIGSSIVYNYLLTYIVAHERDTLGMFGLILFLCRILNSLCFILGNQVVGFRQNKCTDLVGLA